MPIRTQDTGGIEPAYRAYEVGADNRVRSATVIVADSDESAIAEANQVVSEHAVELWDRGRMITRIDPKRRP